MITFGPKLSFEKDAANARNEPDSAIVILCCELAQHGKCGMSENLMLSRGGRNCRSRMSRHGLEAEFTGRRTLVPFQV